MRLADLQAAFQSAVLAGGDPQDADIIDWLASPPRTDRATRFGVYADGYRLRLAEFVANDFPILREHLGDEAFGALVEAYVSATPSHHRNARWYASNLPDFMRQTMPWQDDDPAWDLALFERALADAFDAADAPVLGIEALSDFGAEDWPRLVFAFHPSVAVIDLAHGATAHYQSLAEGEAPAAALAGAETAVVWRSADQSLYRLVGQSERLSLIEARQRKTFGDICMLLAFQAGDEDPAQQAAGFLSQWFADGLITRVSLAE